jgi:hypothetical protein
MWKNPVTGVLHFEVHPCGAQELLVDLLPEGASCQGTLYTNGAHIKDLKEVRGATLGMERNHRLGAPVGHKPQLQFSTFFRHSILSLPCSAHFFMITEFLLDLWHKTASKSKTMPPSKAICFLHSLHSSRSSLLVLLKFPTSPLRTMDSDVQI